MPRFLSSRVERKVLSKQDSVLTRWNCQGRRRSLSYTKALMKHFDGIGVVFEEYVKTGEFKVGALATRYKYLKKMSKRMGGGEDILLLDKVLSIVSETDFKSDERVAQSVHDLRDFFEGIAFPALKNGLNAFKEDFSGSLPEFQDLTGFYDDFFEFFHKALLEASDVSLRDEAKYPLVQAIMFLLLLLGGLALPSSSFPMVFGGNVRGARKKVKENFSKRVRRSFVLLVGGITVTLFLAGGVFLLAGIETIRASFSAVSKAKNNLSSAVSKATNLEKNVASWRETKKTLSEKKQGLESYNDFLKKRDELLSGFKYGIFSDSNFFDIFSPILPETSLKYFFNCIEIMLDVTHYFVIHNSTEDQVLKNTGGFDISDAVPSAYHTKLSPYTGPNFSSMSTDTTSKHVYYYNEVKRDKSVTVPLPTPSWKEDEVTVLSSEFKIKDFPATSVFFLNESDYYKFADFLILLFELLDRLKEAGYTGLTNMSNVSNAVNKQLAELASVTSQLSDLDLNISNALREIKGIDTATLKKAVFKAEEGVMKSLTPVIRSLALGIPGVGLTVSLYKWLWPETEKERAEMKERECLDRIDDLDNLFEDIYDDIREGGVAFETPQSI